MNKVSISRLNELFRLDADTGLLYWKINRTNTVKAGHAAGCINGKRYVQIRVDGIQFYVHRIVWALHHGYWPPRHNQVDHINGNKTDNRPQNLRLATNAQNQMNCPVRSGTKSGLKGVWFYAATGKWKARIMLNRRHIHIGYFDDKEAAHAAYCQRASELHGDFAHQEVVTTLSTVKPPRDRRTRLREEI